MSTWASVPLFTLAWLCVSLTDTGIATTWAPASWAAIAPLRLQASAQTVRPSMASAPRTTSPVSAICGIIRGETKLPTSISRSPAAASWPIQRSFASLAMRPLAICSPSRGPTSQTRTSWVSVPLLIRP